MYFGFEELARVHLLLCIYLNHYTYKIEFVFFFAVFLIPRVSQTRYTAYVTDSLYRVCRRLIIRRVSQAVYTACVAGSL